MDSVVTGSSDEVGSSRITSRNLSLLRVKALATSTICRRPIDKSRTNARGEIPCPGNIASSIAVIIASARRRHPKPLTSL